MATAEAGEGAAAAGEEDADTEMTEILTRFGYPKSPGDTPWSIIDVTGPQSYVQVTPGDPGPPVIPPIGGEHLFPSDFALQSIHIALAMASNDAKFSVNIIGVPASPQGDGTFTVLMLMWMEIDTGEEAATGQDLSQSVVRILAIGN